MDIMRLLNFGCALLLTVCLIFSVVNVMRLQNVVEENKALRTSAEELLLTLREQMSKEPTDTPTDSVPTGTQSTDTQSSLIYCIRSVGNRIGIYTDDGALIRLLDVDPASLPAIDREALENGITVESWEAVLAYIADYTA